MKFKPLYNPSVMTFSMVVPDMKPCTGIQKICGFTRGLSFHQVDYFPYWHISNSIVLGCNRSENEDTVRLWLYGYNNGEHFQKIAKVAKVGDKLNVRLHWLKLTAGVSISDNTWIGNKYMVPNTAAIIKTKTLPVGWILNNYAEIDNTNNKTPFHCPVEDLRVNGRVVKI